MSWRSAAHITGVLKSLNDFTCSRVEESAPSSIPFISFSWTFSTVSLTQEPDGTLPEDSSASLSIPDSAKELPMERAIRERWRSSPPYFALYLSEVGIDTSVDIIWVAF